MKMASPREMLVKFQDLKDEGNTLFKSKAYRCAINTYDNTLQYLCLAIPKNDEDANFMERLGILINLNLTACWFKLKEFKLAK